MDVEEMLRRVFRLPNVLVGPGDKALSELIQKVKAMKQKGREKLVVNHCNTKSLELNYIARDLALDVILCFHKFVLSHALLVI